MKVALHLLTAQTERGTRGWKYSSHLKMDHKSKSECLGVASGGDIIIVIILAMSHMLHHHCIGQQFPKKHGLCRQGGDGEV